MPQNTNPQQEDKTLLQERGSKPLLPQPAFNSLLIRDLSLSVRLGCTAQERAVHQEVRMSIEFRFQKLPSGALTDSLEETICYADVCLVLKKHCQSQEFKLIERMGLEAYQLMRKMNAEDVQIAVTVHKVRPPVEQLMGGSVYRCGDF